MNNSRGLLGSIRGRSRQCRLLQNDATATCTPSTFRIVGARYAAMAPKVVNVARPMTINPNPRPGTGPMVAPAEPAAMADHRAETQATLFAK